MIFTMQRLTIRKEIFLIGVGFLIALSVIFIFMQSVILYRSGMEAARLKIAGANKQIASYVEAHLEGLAAAVKIMAANPDVVNGNEKTMERILSYFRFIEESNPNVKYCYAGYENGELLINNYIPPAGFDPRTRPWYRSAVARYPELSIGFPYQDIKSQEWLNSVSMAFADNTGIRGVFSVDSTVNRMDGLINSIKSFNFQTNYVIDSRGTVLVHENQDYIGKHLDLLTPGSVGLFIEDSGYINYTLNNRSRIAFYTKLKVTNWIIISAIDGREVYMPVLFKVALAVLFMLAVSITFGITQVKVYESRFVRPLESLKKRVTDITSGKNTHEPEEPFSNPELASIAAHIEEMTETSLSRKANEFQLILESTSDGILVLDDSSQVIHYNRRFLELWDLDKELDSGKFDNSAFDRMLESVRPEYTDVMMTRRQVTKGDTTDLIYLKNGTVLEQNSCSLIGDGWISGRLWNYKDVTEKTKVEEKLKLLAATDDLTGLWNRRHFMHQAEYEIAQALRHGRPLCIIQLDIDHFKKINDTHGHAAGDRVLKFLASSLKEQLRSTDTIGRIGGEEFVILFPNTDLQTANAVAEKIRNFFESNRVKHDGKMLSITISMGITSLCSGNNHIDILLRQADEACYAAKDEGRNRITLWNNSLHKNV
ncbi:MAG: diguanylate cyclase [Desulforhopalus sp.]